MLLVEFFNPGKKKELVDEVDWYADLKFFIDNTDECFTRFLYPAIERQSSHLTHPRVYQVYIKPIKRCIKMYAKEFGVTELDKKFPYASIVELAKQIAKEQEEFINRGDYNMRIHEIVESVSRDTTEAQVIGYHKSKLKAGDRVKHPMIAGNFGIVKKIENNLVFVQGVKDRKMYTLSVLQVTPIKEGATLIYDLTGSELVEASCKQKVRKSK